MNRKMMEKANEFDLARIKTIQNLIQLIEKELSNRNYNMPEKFYNIYKLATISNQYDYKTLRRLRIVRNILGLSIFDELAD